MPATSHSKLYALGVLAIACLCVTSFWGVNELSFEEDDQGYMIDARGVVDGTAVPFVPGREFAGRPLIEIFFILLRLLFGDSTAAYHYTAVGCHLVASVLTIWTVRRLGFDPVASVFAGIVFSVAVSHYQVVHWVSGTAYSLYYSLCLVSVSQFLHHLQTGRPLHLAGAIGFQVLAICAHASAISFVPTCLIFAWYTRVRLREVVKPLSILGGAALIPFLSIASIYSDSMTAHGVERAGDWGRMLASWFSYFGGAFWSAHYLQHPMPSHDDMLAVVVGGCLVLAIPVFVHFRLRLPLLAFLIVAAAITPFIATDFELLQVRYFYAATLGTSLLAARFLFPADLDVFRKLDPSKLVRLLAGAALIVVSVAQLHTSIGITHLRDGRSLVSIGQPEGGLHHYRRGYEVAGNLFTSDDLLRMSKVSLFLGESPAPVLEEALRGKHGGDSVLQVLLGVSKFLHAESDSQVVGAQIVSEAINKADNIRVVSSTAAGGLHNVASRYFNLRDYGRAADLYGNALQLDESRKDALEMKARALLYAGKRRLAEGAYGDILECVAEGEIPEHVGVRLLREAVSQASDHPRFWHQLATAFAYAKDLEGAFTAELYAVSHSGTTENWEGVETYLRALMAEDPTRPARAVVDSLISLEDPEPQFLLGLAQLYGRLGDRVSSQEYYRDVLRVAPENRMAKEAIGED